VLHYFLGAPRIYLSLSVKKLRADERKSYRKKHCGTKLRDP